MLNTLDHWTLVFYHFTTQRLHRVVYYTELYFRVVARNSEMPKKKTGARKKAEKQRVRQKEIRSAEKYRDITQQPCNFLMVSCHSIRLLLGTGRLANRFFNEWTLFSDPPWDSIIKDSRSQE